MAEATSMLTFMPWCKIDKPYRTGAIEILPYTRDAAVAGLDNVAQSRVNRIMGMYKSIDGRPVENAAVIQFNGKSPIDVLTDDEADIVDDLVSIACFAALSKRQYFGVPMIYCNSDCFVVRMQKFDTADFVSLTSRRRAGRVMDGGWTPDEVSITMPLNCHNVDYVTIDENLLAAMVRQRDENDGWGRWQNAVSLFNQANTDNSLFPHQVEWVLLCSAFEHLLNAKPEAKDVAAKLADTLGPAQTLLAKDAQRHSDRWRNEGRPLRFEWMYEFYRVRGDFAHGRLNTQQPMVWSPLEHLVLATIAFPLVVKTLLRQNGTYEMTIDDRAQIDCLELLADTKEFCRRPPDQKSGGDSYWNRLLWKRRQDLKLDKGAAELARKLEQKYPQFFNKETEPNDPKGM